MKKLTLLIICFLIASKLLAQDCTHNLYMQKNKTIEMTFFDKKGNVKFKGVSTVSDVNTSGGVTTAHVVSEAYDKNGKEMGSTNVDYKCDGGVISMQMSFNSPQTGNQKGKMEITNKGGFVEYPSGMQVGDHLKDATSILGIGAMTTTVKFTNRMVVAKENVTTPAGSWDCYKITYNSTSTSAFNANNQSGVSSGRADTMNTVFSKLSKLGIKMPSNTSQTTMWYAPDFGAVKEQTKEGTSMITAIK